MACVGEYESAVIEETESMTTREVFDHHVKSFAEGDLDAILADYSPTAIMFTPEGTLKGLDAIRPFFQALLAEFGQPGTAFSMKVLSIEGDFAYCIWTAETADNVYELGTDTLVVRDGRIVAQSYTSKITPRAETCLHSWRPPNKLTI